MDFITLMRHMFDMQEAFPDMRWHVVADNGSNQMNIAFSIDPGHAELLEQAKEMF